MWRIASGHCPGIFTTLCPEDKRGLHVATSADVLPGLRGLLDAGDVVLVKGSLSMKLGLIVDAIRKMSHPDIDADPQDTE